MKLRQLEILLERIEGFDNPSARKEQYPTPAPLAARLLFHACLNGDIKGRNVLDPGCGTGVLAIGALLLGASEVTGIDNDRKALKKAQENADNFGVMPQFIHGEVGESLVLPGTYDTTVMNPPFGAQVRHADRAFIDCAVHSSKEVYTIANAGSLGFITSYIEGRATVREVTGGILPLRHSYHFHRRAVQNINVEIIHLSRIEPL